MEGNINVNNQKRKVETFGSLSQETLEEAFCTKQINERIITETIHRIALKSPYCLYYVDLFS